MEIASQYERQGENPVELRMRHYW